MTVATSSKCIFSSGEIKTRRMGTWLFCQIASFQLFSVFCKCLDLKDGTGATLLLELELTWILKPAAWSNSLPNNCFFALVITRWFEVSCISWASHLLIAGRVLSFLVPPACTALSGTSPHGFVNNFHVSLRASEQCSIH